MVIAVNYNTTNVRSINLVKMVTASTLSMITNVSVNQVR